MSEEIEKPHYEIYAALMNKNGYVYDGFSRPYDYYSDGKNRIGICVPCGRLMINGHMIFAFRGNKSISMHLKEYFNETEKEKTETTQ